MTAVYIGDTNIWIDFRNAGLLAPLFALPFELCCTEFVLDELDDFDHEWLCEQGLRVVGMESDAISDLGSLTAEHNNSSLADVSCYYLAKQTGFPLLTGDGQLRKQAKRDGIRVHGALWLLDQLVEENVIRAMQAHDGLKVMLATNARLPTAECEARFAKWSAAD